MKKVIIFIDNNEKASDCLVIFHFVDFMKVDFSLVLLSRPNN